MTSGPLIFGANAGSIQQTLTGHFYPAAGGRVNRIADRLLVGGATVQDGESGSTNKTWLGQSAGGVNRYMDITSQLEVLPAAGGVVGLAAGARSQENDPYDGCFAITAHGRNDHTTTDQSAWGIYASAVRVTLHGVYTASIECDTTTLQPQVVANAYNVVPLGVTIGLSIAAGGESALDSVGVDSGLTVNPTSAGIAFFTAGTGVNIANPVGYAGACFRKGILFQSNSIAGTDGNLGTWGSAMEMCKGHAIVWKVDNPELSVGGMIRSENNATTYQTRAIFSQSQFQIRGVAPDLTTEYNAFAVNPLPGATAVNCPVVAPSLAGDPVILTAQGADTHIDLYLAPKGTSGLIRLGNRGAQAASVAANFTATHMIPIKDAAGTVYYLPCRLAAW
jgi:hypothetical protein